MPVEQGTLSEQDRKKLDSIVSQMSQNGEKDDDIQFVVNDFKTKYGVKKNETPSQPSGDTLPKEPSEENAGMLESFYKGAAGLAADILPASIYSAMAGGVRVNPYTDKDLEDTNSISYAANELFRQKIGEGDILGALSIGDKEAKSYIQEQIQQPEEFKKAALEKKVDLLAKSQEQKQEFEKYTKDIPKTISSIEKPGDVGSYVAYQIGQAIPQMGLAFFSGGMSSYVQEYGSIYDDQLQKIAEDKGITVEEVVKQELDDPAAGQAAAAFAAGLDRVGLEAIVKTFGKDAIKSMVKSASKYEAAKTIGKSGLKAGLTEGTTESAQYGIEEVGSSLGAGRDLSKSLSDLDPAEAGESFAAGFVSGKVIGASGATISSIVKRNNEKANEQPTNTQTEGLAQNVEGQPTTDQVLQEPGLTNTITDGGTTTPTTDQPLQTNEGVPQGQTAQEQVQPSADQVGQGTPETATPVLENVKASPIFYATQESSLDNSVDLTGEEKQPYLKTLNQMKESVDKTMYKDKKSKALADTEAETLFKMNTQYAVDQGLYEKSIQEGRISASDVKNIIESADIEVPESINLLSNQESDIRKQINSPTIDVLSSSFEKVDTTPMPEGNKFEGRSEYMATDKGFTLSIKPTAKGYQVFLGEPGTDAGGVRTFGQIESWFPQSEKELNAVILEAKSKIDELSQTKSLVEEERGAESEQDQVIPPVPQQDTADTPPPIQEEGVSSMPDEGKKERKVAERFMSDPDVSDEIKSGLTEKGRFYIPVTDIGRQADADAIIEAKGVEESIKMISDPDSGITESTRVFVGKTLYKKLKQDVKSAETETEKDVIRDQINKLVEDIAQLGTRAGQTVQAFSGMFTSDVEQVAHALKIEAERSRNKALKSAEADIKTLQDVMDIATDEALKTLLQDPRIKSLLSESNKTKNVKASKRKQFTKSLLDKLDAIERELDDSSGKVFDATYRLGLVIYKSAINIIRTAVKSGDSLADAVESAVSNIKQNVKDWNEDGFRKQFEKEIAQETNVDRKTLAEVLSESGDDFTSLALEHYTKYSSKRQTISEKLQEKFNMEEGEANRLGKALDNIVSEKRKALIEKRFASKLSSPATKKAAKNLAQRIADLTNLGGLSDKQTRETYAESVGLAGMTDEQAREMQRLVEVAESKPEGFARYQAVQDMVKFHQKANGYSWTAVVESIWYANMLSGISTQSLNFQANAVQTLGETFVGVAQSMVEYKNPTTAVKNLSFMMKGLVDGYNKGLAESATVLKDGYTPLKSQKFDKSNNLSGVRTAESDVLELMDKKNPLNYWKYVGRLMAATDILFYGGLKGMRSRQLAFRIAYNQNKNTYSKEMLADANAIIGANDGSLKLAKQQAEQEGFKGKDFNRRVNEILEQQQPEALREDANNFAAHGTFNYDPEGILGVMTSTINTATTRLPLLKVIVPFTRVISNVTNSYLDWTPWGLVRAAKGGMGIPNKASYKKFTQEEKLRELIKATTGTAAMVAMYALSQPGEDGEEPLVELTADGTGNLQKNYELGETGWKEYTFKLKGSDLRFEYRNSPLGIPFAIIGYLNDSKKYKGKDVTEDQMGLIFSGTLSYISDMSFLSGMSDFFEIISDKNNYGSIGEKLGVFAQRTAKTLVVPNAFTQTSRAIQEIVDSPMKKANSFYGQITRDMPVLRDSMGDLYNSLGEPVVAEQLYKFNPVGTRFTTEADEKEKDSYKVWELIAETGAYIGAPSKNVKVYDPKLGYTRELEDNEYQKYAILAGQYTKKMLLSSYETILAQKDISVQKKLIGKMKEAARTRAKAELFY